MFTLLRVVVRQKPSLQLLRFTLKVYFSNQKQSNLFARQVKGQGMRIAGEKIEEIWREFPLLKKEIIRSNMSNTNVHLWFRNGSEFTIVAGA